MDPPAAERAPRHSHVTIVSPALERDLWRLKRAAPFLAILLLFAAVYGAAFYASGLMMGPQERWAKPVAPARRFGLSPETVSFQSSDGIALKAWWEMPWSVPASKGTVILVHGAQMNKTGMAFTAARLLPQGFSVLVLDLRAHGESGGDYTTFGYKEALDVQAAIQWVKTHHADERIALLGYSSGAVASLLAAARTPGVAAVIADSAYLDPTDVLRRENEFLQHPPPNVHVPPLHRLRLWLFTSPAFSWLVRTAFHLRSGVPFNPPEANVLDAVRKIDRIPVLYLSAERDPVVPRETLERLYRATATSNKRLVVLPGAYHSAMAGDPRRYMAEVTAFLDAAFGTQATPEP